MTVVFGLDQNRAMTEVFISTAPTQITLTPREVGGDGTGGRTKTLLTPRPEQTFSLLEPGNSAYQQAVATEDGEQQVYDYLLLGRWDAEMAEDDVLKIDDRDYVIHKILPDNGYEKRGMVLRSGW